MLDCSHENRSLVGSTAANRPAVVVSASEAPHIETLSDAAARNMKWKLGVDYAFQDSMGGWTALTKYHLPLASVPRSMEHNELFPKLESGELTMIAARAT